MPDTLEMHYSPAAHEQNPYDWRRPTPWVPSDSEQFIRWTLALLAREPRTAEEALFNRLATRWIKETSIEPSLLKKSVHPAYQRIIAMGPPVIPLILKEMKKRPGHWFWALQYLIQDEPNPAASCETLQEARAAWLKWGESKGYL